MRHLNDGLLRRLVDEPLAIADSQKKHLAGCPVCGARYALIEADAREAVAALQVPAYAPNVATALARVNRRVEALSPARSSSRVAAPRWRGPGLSRALGGLTAACAALAVVTLTPAGSLAQNFVTIFQPKGVAAVQLTSLDVRSLSQLRHYGTIRVPSRVASQPATSADDAARLSGMSVMTPSSAPAGVTASPVFTVSPGATASFTFSGAKAAAWAAKAGKTLPAMPAGVDGSTIDVTVGAAVVATYGGCTTGCSTIPQLVIGQMVAPRIASTGANLNQLENYVFSLPGVSPQLATELRSIGDPTSTLPIPIPASFAHADSVNVQGVQGEAIGDNTGVGSLVVWEKDGVVYAVGGTMPLAQVESISNSLR